MTLKTGGMAAENSALHHMNKLHFKVSLYIVIIFHNVNIYIFFLNASLRDFKIYIF